MALADIAQKEEHHNFEKPGAEGETKGKEARAVVPEGWDQKLRAY